MGNKIPNAFSYLWQTNKDRFSQLHSKAPLIQYGFGAPFYQQAFNFLSEKYNLYYEPYTTTIGGNIDYTFRIRDLYSEEYIHDNLSACSGGYSETFSSPEDSNLNGIKKLIELIKENK
jgi:hypothetical protein